MIETFLASDIGMLLMTLSPAVAAVVAIVISALIILHRVAVVINEFRGSNDVAMLRKSNKELQAECHSLFKEVKEVKENISGIHSFGYTDPPKEE